MRYSTDGQQTDHPLRAIRMLADEALLPSMSMQLERLYSTTGRLSIPPEQLPRALLFQVLCRVRSEQLRMEEPDYNPLFRCSVGLNKATPVWDRTTFWQESGPVAGRRGVATFFDAISCQARAAGPPSDEHFAVDGHALGACERRCDDMHQSTNHGDQRGQRQAGCARSAGRAVVPLPAGYRPCSA